MKSLKQAKHLGFTLTEIVVVVAIVAILASAAAPIVQLGNHRLKEHQLRHALREIRSAIDHYRVAVMEGRIAKKADASSYPLNLNILTEGVPDLRSPVAHKIYFLRRIPRDPFADPETASNGTWGLRSYTSSPDDPQPGEDVFDVYSLNLGTGSNGIPYRQW